MSFSGFALCHEVSDSMPLSETSGAMCTGYVGIPHASVGIRTDCTSSCQVSVNHGDLRRDKNASIPCEVKSAHRASSERFRHSSKSKAGLRHSMKLHRRHYSDRHFATGSQSDSERLPASRTTSLQVELPASRTTNHKSLSESKSGLACKTRSNFRRSIQRTASKMTSRSSNSPQCDAVILASQHTLNHDPQMIGVNEAILDLFQKKVRPLVDTIAGTKENSQQDTKPVEISKIEEYDFGNSQNDFNNLPSICDSRFLNSSTCGSESALFFVASQSPSKSASSESVEVGSDSSSVLGSKLWLGRKSSRMMGNSEEKSISSGLNKILDSGRKPKTMGRLDTCDNADLRDQLDNVVKCVVSLEQRYDAMCIMENLHRTLVKGMIVLRQQLVDLHGIEFMTELKAIWSWFYSRTINDISSIFCTTQSLLVPYIRPLCLSEFRDHIMVHHHVRTTLMEQIREGHERPLPQEISQMLHVLSSRCYSDPLDLVSRKIIKKLLNSMVQNTDNDCSQFVARLQKYFKSERESQTQQSSNCHSTEDPDVPSYMTEVVVQVNSIASSNSSIYTDERVSSNMKSSARTALEPGVGKKIIDSPGSIYQFPVRSLAQDRQGCSASPLPFPTNFNEMKAGANWNSVSGCVSRSFDSPCDMCNNQNDDALRSTQSLPHNKKGAINMGLAIRRALTASAATLLEMTEFASPQQANTDSQPWRSPVSKECPVKYVKKPDSTVSRDDSGSTGKPSSRRIRASSVLEVGGRMMRMRKKSGQSDKSQTQKCGSSGEKSRQDKWSKQYEQVMNVAAAEHFQHQEKNKVHVGRHRSATLASAASITLQKSLSRELQSSQDSIDQMGSEDEDVLPLSMGIGKGHNRANTRDTCTKPNGPNFAAGKVSGLGFRRFSVIRDESRSNLFYSDSELSTSSILASSVSSNNDEEQCRPDIAQKLDQNTPTYRASSNKNCDDFAANSGCNGNQLYSQRANIHTRGGQGS